MDSLTSETYPSGRQVLTGYNPLNQPNSVALASLTKTYVANATYAAHGSLVQRSLGNSLVDNWQSRAARVAG